MLRIPSIAPAPRAMRSRAHPAPQKGPETTEFLPRIRWESIETRSPDKRPCQIGIVKPQPIARPKGARCRSQRMTPEQSAEIGPAHSRVQQREGVTATSNAAMLTTLFTMERRLYDCQRSPSMAARRDEILRHHTAVTRIITRLGTLDPAAEYQYREEDMTVGNQATMLLNRLQRSGASPRHEEQASRMLASAIPTSTEDAPSASFSRAPTYARHLSDPRIRSVSTRSSADQVFIASLRPFI